MVEISRYSTGKVDWEKTIRVYAAEMEMTFADAMKFLAGRPSLHVAAEMIGVYDLKRDVLNDLGAFLDSRSYSVPKLEGDLSNAERGLPSMSHATRVRREQESSRPLPTKEEYLDLRADGLTKTLAFAKFHVGPVKGDELLREWGMGERATERAAVQQWKLQREVPLEPEAQAVAPIKSSPIDVSLQITKEAAVTSEAKDEVAHEISEPKFEDTNTSSPQTYTQVVDNSETSETSEELEYIPVRIPLRFDGLTGNKPSYSRDELIAYGLQYFQTAAAWAYKEMVDLLGDEATLERVENFIERKVSAI